MILDATVQKDRVTAKILAERTTICELKEDLEKKTKLATKTEESLADTLKTLSDIDSCLSEKTISFQFCDKRTEGFSLGDINGAFGDLVMKDMIVTLSRKKSQCTGKIKNIAKYISVSENMIFKHRFFCRYNDQDY